ncbi:MAG: hypothetical protein IJO71_07985 [Microbacterium sp.]|uniref:HNH endonuclease n=1 Tax=Microbacterium sp. TaxID=51671 RepID=UPI0025E097BA|nr:HNH endonuclease [Microbacterium sp.]MBQ9917123.1 hypothetical protein [Microbacterium sp.]
MDDGSTFEVRRFIPESTVVEDFRILAQARYRAFERCPICLDEDPTSAEHVPPRGLGGVVLTATCMRCNNELGSRLENDLQDWFDDAVHVRFASDAVRGSRRTPRLLVRQNQNGSPVFMMDRGRIDPEVQRMLEAGERFEIVATETDPRRARLGALKSAYLASCVFLDAIPESTLAGEIRRLLVQTRDAARTEPIEASPIIDNLNIGRSYAEGEPVVELLARETGDGRAEAAISLARTVVVSWPLEPLGVRIEHVDPGGGTP